MALPAVSRTWATTWYAPAGSSPAVTLHLPPLTVVVRVCPAMRTVTGLAFGALLVPVIVGVVSFVAASPPSMAMVGGSAVVNRMVLASTVTAAWESARPISSVLAPTVIAAFARMVPNSELSAPVPAAPKTTQ